jgi:hypothetical protein
LVQVANVSSYRMTVALARVTSLSSFSMTRASKVNGLNLAQVAYLSSFSMTCASKGKNDLA